jgi:hypothetical protein
MNTRHIALRTGLASLALAFAAAAPASADIRINEIESQDAGGDWVELVNTGNAPVDITGYVVRDASNNLAATVGAKTLQPGEFFAQDANGLGNDDGARLLDGATLVDSFAWGPHAVDTYGRCPDGTGVFRQTLAPTKGAANNCAPFGETWPGGAAVTEQPSAMFVGGENVSGLAYQASGTSARGTLWAVQNNPSVLYKLTWDGTKWVNAAGWASGKQMDYPNPLNGVPDAEGVTFADGDPNALYVATERDGGGPSMPAVLRIDIDGAAPLKATEMWDLSAQLPGLPANEGPEAITFVPDTLLLEKGLIDESTGAAYNPADYAGHGQGLFLLGVEQSGQVVAFALQPGGVAKKVATFSSGFRKIMDLSYEPETKRVWAVCDDSCDDQTATLEISGGKFAVTKKYERPGDMPMLNNEGFTIAPQAECQNNRKPTFYTDDSATNGLVLREGSLSCTPPAPGGGDNNGGNTGGGNTGGGNNGGDTGGGTIVNPQPSPTPQPLADRTAPSLKVALKVTRKTGKLGVTTTLGEKADLTIKVTARKSAKAKARTLLKSTRKGAAAGKQTFTLTLKKSVRAKLRKGERVTISIVARDAAGNVTTRTASAKVR